MSKRRPSGDGMVRKKEDGRWERRIVVGHKANGDPIFRYVYGRTQKELLSKLHQSIETYQDVELTEDSRTASGWTDGWTTTKRGRSAPVPCMATDSMPSTISSRSWAIR